MPAAQHAGHGAAAGVFAAAATMWFAMMVAMMLPTVLPWILLFARMSRARGGGARETWSFVAGYLLAWLGYSLLAAGIQVPLAAAAALHGPDLRVAPAAGGAILLAAGLFQFTSLKRRCLTHCRSPLGYLLARWTDGPAAAISLGIRHGVYCVICCAALMAVSFALGVMNLWWMAALTAVLCVEKALPAGDRLGRAFGVVLVVWGCRNAFLG